MSGGEENKNKTNGERALALATMRKHPYLRMIYVTENRLLFVFAFKRCLVRAGRQYPCERNKKHRTRQNERYYCFLDNNSCSPLVELLVAESIPGHPLGGRGEATGRLPASSLQLPTAVKIFLPGPPICQNYATNRSSWSHQAN